jgi:thiazole/oxazole-forming peptide maturase SagD family component
VSLEELLPGNEEGLSPDRVEVRPAFAEIPGLLIGTAAAVSESFPPNRYAMGARVITGAACGLCEGQVRMRAFGELVERVSAFRAGSSDSGFRTARYADLHAAAIPALSPQLLRQQRTLAPMPSGDDDGNPYLLTISWCSGLDLSTGKSLWVPALACFLDWRPPSGENVFIRPDATGLAAGTDAEGAQFRALLEVIERRACVRSWRDGRARVGALDSGQLSQPYVEACRALGLALDLFALTPDELPDTVIAILARPDGSESTVGSATAATVPVAIEKAVQEALMLQRTMRNVSWTSVSIDRPKTSLDRVARAYRNGAEIREWYRARAATTARGSATAQDWNLERLVQATARAFGCPVVSIDVTDTIARSMGWSVFRLLAPDTRPEEFDSNAMRSDPHPFG